MSSRSDNSPKLVRREHSAALLVKSFSGGRVDSGADRFSAGCAAPESQRFPVCVFEDATSYGSRRVFACRSGSSSSGSGSTST